MSESEHIKKAKPDADPSVAGGDGGMVGRVVQGVIDGKFDAGYVINVKVGDTDTHLRGVVFLPGQYVPVTAANDLAPSAKMYQRTDITMPVPNFQNQQQQLAPSAGQPYKQPVENKIVMPIFQGHGIPSIAVMGDTLFSEGTGEQLKHMVSGMETLSASIGATTVQDKAAVDNNEILQASALKDFPASVEIFRAELKSKPSTVSPAITEKVADPIAIKCPTFDQSQTQVTTYIHTWLEINWINSIRKQACSIETGAPEPAPKIVNGDTISEPNGRPMDNAFQLTGAKTRGEVRTELNLAAEGSLFQGIVPSEICATSVAAIAKAGLDTESLTSASATMSETNAVLLETEPAHDGFLLSKMEEPGRCSSSGTAVTKDGDIINAIPPTES